MLKEDREILTQFFETIEKEIKARIPRVTGSTQASITHDIGLTGGVLYGSDYIFTLEYGRGPTKGEKGAGKTLRRKLQDWVIAKGLATETKQAKGMAWAIATKIHSDGSKLFRNKGRSGIITDVITSKRIEALTGSFADNYVNYVVGLAKEIQADAKKRSS